MQNINPTADGLWNVEKHLPRLFQPLKNLLSKRTHRDFPGGSGVKNLPANARVRLNLDPARLHTISGASSLWATISEATL